MFEDLEIIPICHIRSLLPRKGCESRGKCTIWRADVSRKLKRRYFASTKNIQYEEVITSASKEEEIIYHRVDNSYVS